MYLTIPGVYIKDKLCNIIIIIVNHLLQIKFKYLTFL